MTAQLEVESIKVTAGSGEGRAEFQQSGTDLTLRPHGPVCGAVARCSLLFEPLGAFSQALSTFKERGVRLRVGEDLGCGPLAGRRILATPGESSFRQKPDESPAEPGYRIET